MASNLDIYRSAHTLTGNMVDDRRRALDAWGHKLESILDGKSAGGDNVVPMRGEEG